MMHQQPYDLSRMLRDSQLKSALVSEKERTINARRAALVELRQQVQAAQLDCAQRQTPLANEMARLNAAKEDYAISRNERDSHARAQQQRLNDLRDEETRLIHHGQATEHAIATAVERIRLARLDSAQFDAVDSAIASLKHRSESEEQTLAAFEDRVRTVDATVQQRRAVAKLHQLSLPNGEGIVLQSAAAAAVVEPTKLPQSLVTSRQQSAAQQHYGTAAGDHNDAGFADGATMVFFDDDSAN